LILPLALVATTSFGLAQSPPERIQTGFKSLSTGNWESAMKQRHWMLASFDQL
jgi:hypothetical protein